jgi:hypothetical protein
LPLASCLLPGCGAPLSDVTATATSAATYTTETLLTYTQAAPGDSAAAAANATELLTDCQMAIADAKAMPSTQQVQADAAAAIQIIAEIIQMIPQVLPMFGDKKLITEAAISTNDMALRAKLLDLKLRLQVIHKRYATGSR